jgi:hypothetical protein
VAATLGSILSLAIVNFEYMARSIVFKVHTFCPPALFWMIRYSMTDPFGQARSRSHQLAVMVAVTVMLLLDHLPPERFCSHCQFVSRLYIAVLPFLTFVLPHRRAAVAITPQTPPPRPLCGCSQLVRLGIDMLVPDDKLAPIQMAEHYRQYRQQLAKIQ